MITSFVLDHHILCYPMRPWQDPSLQSPRCCTIPFLADIYPISYLVVETPDLNFKLPLGSAAPGTCQRKHLYITWWLSYLCTWPKILKWLLQQLSSGPVKICNPMLALDCTYLWKKQLLWNWFFSGTRASCPLNLLRRNVYVTRCLYWAALTLD